MATAGETLMLGIAVEVDASGVVRGVSLADQQLNRLKTRGRRAGQDFSRNLHTQMSAGMQLAGASMMTGLATVGAGEAMRRFVLNPMLENAEDFEVEFSRLRFISGAAGAELEEMRQLALTTGVETQFSPTQAVSGLRRLRAAGLETREAMTELRSALDLATASAGMLDLDRATASTAAAIAQFRHQFAGTQNEMRAGRIIMDTWAQATRETAFNMEEIPIVMRSLRGMPNVWRAQAHEVFSFAGILRSAGLTAADSAQAISGLGRRFAVITRMVERFRSQGETGRVRTRMIADAFQRFGVEIFTTEGRLRSMTDVVTELISAYSRYSTDRGRISDLNTLLGQQASQLISAGASFRRFGLEGTEAVQELLRRVQDSGGAMREGAAAFETTIKGMKVFLVGSLQTIAVALGEALEPALKAVISLGRIFVNTFLGFVRAHPAMARVIAFLILGFTVMTLSIGTTMLAVSGLAFFVLSLATAFTAATVAGITLEGVLGVLTGIVWPLLLVVAVLAAGVLLVAAAIGVLVLAYENNLGGIKDFIGDWVTDITLLWRSMVDWFSNDRNSLSVTLREQLAARGLEESFLRLAGFVRRLEEVWNGLKDVVVPVVKGMAAIFGWFISLAVAAIDILEEALASLGFKFSENMDLWRTAGWILGVFLVGVILVATLAFVALAAVMVLTAALAFITALPFLLLIGVIVLIVGGIIWFITLLKRAVVAISEWASNTWKPIAEFGRRFGIFWDRLIAADAPWRAHMSVLGTWLAGVFEPATKQFRIFGYDVTTEWNYIAEVIDRAALRITSAAHFVYETWAGILAPVGEFFSNLGNGISVLFGYLIDQARDFGGRFVSVISDSISDAWGGLVDSFSDHIVDVRDLLPGSNAKTGPLSTLTESGQGLVTTWMSGIQSMFPGLISGLQMGMGDVASALGMSTGVGGGGPERIATGVAGAAETAVTARTESGGGAGRSIQVTFGDINVSVQQASPEEAERLSTLIMERLQESMDNETEMSFA